MIALLIVLTGFVLVGMLHSGPGPVERAFNRILCAAMMSAAAIEAAKRQRATTKEQGRHG